MRVQPAHSDTKSAPRAIKTAKLEEIMKYENRDVVERYIVEQDASPQRASELFEDLKRWMWLCGESHREQADGKDNVPALTIFDRQKDLDEMWHTFILFTPQYVDFCFKYFGIFIHHAPTPEREKREFLQDADPERRERASQHKAELMRRNAAYVYDKLGEDVARRWFLPKSAQGHADYQGVNPDHFHAAYRGSAPWEIGRPQPRILEVLDDGGIAGDVLDLGCGTGENSFAIAQAGHEVVGVDFVPRAVELASNKAHARGIERVSFEIGDALDLHFDRRFATIVDSGVFHGFSNEDRKTYARVVADHVKPGGLLHVVCFSDKQGGFGPRRIARSELHALFNDPKWTVRSIVPCSYHVRSGRKPAWHCTVERTSASIVH